MRAAKVAAQAKINLVLNVLLRQTTGFHDLVTVFRRIDLADDIVVRVGGTVRALDCNGPAMPPGGLGPPDRNLAYRAAVEYANRKGWPLGFSIELTKKIPVGGGLGGGSADAGAMLRALNALAPDPMSAEELWSAACALGSDVPFLATEAVVATGTGPGTRLTDLETSGTAQHLVIVVPPFSIATADAYRWLDEDRERQASPTTSVAKRDGNDFEDSVERRHPVLRQIRERLRESGARLTRLAGSGSCVFGLFDDAYPASLDLGIEAEIIRTKTSARVVQVEVLE
jgi:4-diphosphocytidyl-2-C-methyl-D-erythritol kinase